MFHRNAQKYGDVRSWIRVSSHIIYTVEYYLPKRNFPWQQVSGSTESVETAARMIVEAIQITSSWAEEY